MKNYPNMKKVRKPKLKDENKSIGLKATIGTLALCLVALVVTLVICAINYNWTWDTILYWLNPFTEGNHITFMVYMMLVCLLLVLIWFIHQERQKRR